MNAVSKNNFCISLSSGAFRNPETRDRIVKKSRELCHNAGVEFCVQLHNTCSLDEIGYFRDNKIQLSAHAPLGQLFNWNFTASDMTKIWSAVDENIDYMHSLGINQSVCHVFFMTDEPVPAFGHGRSISECMMEVFRPELARWNDKLINRNFTNLPEYKIRRERVKNNLAILRERHPEFMLCVENDYPAYGEGSMLPDDLIYYDNPLCLDTGHLWITSKLFNLDFYAEAMRMISTGMVKMLHLHASKYSDDYQLRDWGDGHLPLSIANAEKMHLKEITRAAVDNGVQNIVLEIPTGTEDDVQRVLEYLS